MLMSSFMTFSGLLSTLRILFAGVYTSFTSSRLNSKFYRAIKTKGKSAIVEYEREVALKFWERHWWDLLLSDVKRLMLALDRRVLREGYAYGSSS